MHTLLRSLHHILAVDTVADIVVAVDTAVVGNMAAGAVRIVVVHTVVGCRMAES